jgi:hypothetical protein
MKEFNIHSESFWQPQLLLFLHIKHTIIKKNQNYNFKNFNKKLKKKKIYI